MSDLPKPYDSGPDTRKHIAMVATRLRDVEQRLRDRERLHDLSKLSGPEKEGFDVHRQMLDRFEHGSPEMEAHNATIKPLLGMHFARNRHHPEHFAFTDPGELIADPWSYDEEMVADGTAVGRMTLIDIIEMLCDWDAAAHRKPDGVLNLDYNIKKFGIGPQLASILRHTAHDLGFLRSGE